MAMNILPLAVEEWTEVDWDFTDQMAEKRRVMALLRPEVFGALPSSDAACAELRDLLVAHVLADHPDRFQAAPGGVRIPAIGETLDPHDPTWHPIEMAGLLAQEDWCVLQAEAEEGPYVLTAGSLCFPSRWRLGDKLGRPLAAVHGPVPLYAEKLARPVDRFFLHLKPDKPVRRVNWGVIDDPTLCQFAGHGRTGVNPAITPENAGDTLWLRMERQTLRRLPVTGAIVFGIRTYVHPLAVFADDPAGAADLAQGIRTMPDEMKAYKSIASYEAALLAFLDRLAGASP
jgi:hypothetical protein